MSDEQLVLKLSVNPMPVFWYGHFDRVVERQDARFFCVLPVPNPLPRVIVIDGIDMLKPTFGLDPDIAVGLGEQQKLSTPKGRIDYATMELACSIHSARCEGVPIITLGVDADHDMFKGTQVHFLQGAAEALSAALSESPHFSSYQRGVEKLRAMLDTWNGPAALDPNWLDKLPYQDSLDNLLKG